LNGNVQNGEENSDKRILTDLEEADLVRFLIDSNLARDGKNMTEIGIKVRFECVKSMKTGQDTERQTTHQPAPCEWAHLTFPHAGVVLF
jgi:hypothetical protein